MLRVNLPPTGAPVQHLVLPDPLDARTWTVGLGSSDVPFHLACDLLTHSLGGSLEHKYVQFRMDSLGRHEYVNLGDVQGFGTKRDNSEPLPVILEDAVKEIRREKGDEVVVLTASYPDVQVEAEQTPISEDENVLCPSRGLWRNYNVCEDLSLGRTQRVIVSDESTLHTGVEANGIQIFNYLSLIVNCHETSASARPDKYRVGSANPRVIYQPIHELMRATPEHVVTTMDWIQEAVWESLQTGSVAVHCLAGVHRAPTVIVCHYLWRHYKLGHSKVCNDFATIYERLRALGPGVEPLSYLTLIDTYQKYLISKHVK